MVRYVWLSILLLFTDHDTHKLVKTKISNEISVSIPEEFSPTTPEDVSHRYPSARKPLGAFTNEYRTVDFIISTSVTQWPDADLNMARQFFKAGINYLYDKVDWIDEGLHTVHHNQYIYFEFDSKLNGSSLQSPITRYTYIQYRVESDQTLVFTFTCLGSSKEEWQKTAHEVMQSIRIR